MNVIMTKEGKGESNRYNRKRKEEVEKELDYYFGLKFIIRTEGTRVR